MKILIKNKIIIEKLIPYGSTISNLSQFARERINIGDPVTAGKKIKWQLDSPEFMIGTVNNGIIINLVIASPYKLGSALNAGNITNNDRKNQKNLVILCEKYNITNQN